MPFKAGLARLACNVTVDGEPWPYCPRTILVNAVERAEKLGYRLKMGIELEFFLVKERDGQLVLLDDLDTLDQPCYDMKGLTRNYEFISTLSKYQNELGWGNYANDHEDANGQFESNFEYDDALVTADRAIFFRYMVHAMAQERGHLATFMPKPFAHLTGNGATSTSRCGTRPARRTCSPTTTTRAASVCRSSPTRSWAASSTTPRRCSRSARRRSTRTSGSASAPPLRAPPGRRRMPPTA